LTGQKYEIRLIKSRFYGNKIVIFEEFKEFEDTIGILFQDCKKQYADNHPSSCSHQRVFFAVFAFGVQLRPQAIVDFANVCDDVVFFDDDFFDLCDLLILQIYNTKL